MRDIVLCEHLDSLYGYAMSLSRNPVEAADLAQETCFKALDAWGRLPPESNVKGWLFTILRHTWFNHLRRQRNGGKFVELPNSRNISDIAVDASRNPYEHYISKLDVQRVRAAIQQLPPQFKEVILLREIEDLSYAVIAEQVGCPVGTIMSRLARARSRLRDILACQ